MGSGLNFGRLALSPMAWPCFSSIPQFAHLLFLGIYFFPRTSVGDALLSFSPQTSGPQVAAWVPFPTVDVPDHAHYTLGTVILLVGLTGMLGNLTVIYTFCRCLVGGVGSRALRISTHIHRTEYKGKRITQLYLGHVRIVREVRSTPSIVSGLGINFQADEKGKWPREPLNTHACPLGLRHNL